MPKPKKPTNTVEEFRSHLRTQADRVAAWIGTLPDSTPADGEKNLQVIYNRLLADKGEPLTETDHSDTIPAAKTWKKRHKPKPKSCFDTAQRFAIDTPGATYYEGYVILPPPFGAVHHAWVVVNGSVVDMLLEGQPEERTYFGVTIPTEWLRERYEATGETAPYAHTFYLGSAIPFLD